MLDTSIECVLFDLDGTLVDTAPDFVNVLNALRGKHSLPPLPEQDIVNVVSDGARALIKLGFTLSEHDEGFAQLLQELLDNYHAELSRSQARLYPGFDELLLELEAQNIPWGVVTNKPEKYSTKLFNHLGLSNRCKTLICPDHVANSKPHPEPILLACEKLDCDLERTVYLGDHHRDMIAAKNADVIAIAASYGYITNKDDVVDWGADFILASPDQLKRLLNMLKFS